VDGRILAGGQSHDEQQAKHKQQAFHVIASPRRGLIELPRRGCIIVIARLLLKG
jgi:hypothetical protein